ETPSQSPVQALLEPFCDALSRLLAPDTIDRMAGDAAYASPIISAILQTAIKLASDKTIDPKDVDAVRTLLEDAIRIYAKEHDLPLSKGAPGERVVWAHPLGVLATDHVGYLSFDLIRLSADVADALALALRARRRDPSTPTETSIWLYPMAREADAIDALAQGRFAHDAIVVKLELPRPLLLSSVEHLGMLAMQNPGLTDWRLSP